MFTDFFKLGTDHILDLNGFDHILFVTTLCALYRPDQWKKLIILVTAFTLGHSLTLALSSLNMMTINSALVEILIPITIILTGLYNIITVQNKTQTSGHLKWNYLLASGFGLIHGLGFSNYFKAILGKENEIIKPLFAFNLGVEAGQIFIVSVFILLAYIILNIMNISKYFWTISVSLISIAVALTLLYEKI